MIPYMFHQKMVPTSRPRGGTTDAAASCQSAECEGITPASARLRLDPGEQYLSLGALMGGENLPELMRWLDE